MKAIQQIKNLTTSLQVKEIGAMVLVEGRRDVLEALKSLLTLTPTKGKQYTLKLYEEDKQGLHIPRGLITYNTNVYSKTIPNKYKANIQLRPEQKPLVTNYIISCALKSFHGGIIQAPTGWGKSIVGIDLISKLHLKTLIVVPTDRIFTQWQEKLKEFSNFRVGTIRQNVCNIKDKDVVVAMLHSISKKGRYGDIYNCFDHVIFDEIHTIATQTFSTVASMFNCIIRTAFSATPRRKDGMDLVFLSHIGDIVVKYDTVDVTPKVIAVDYYDLTTHHKGCVWNGELQLGRYYNKLLNNRGRTRYIAGYILKAYANKHNILMLSERIRHLSEMKSILLEYGIDSEDIGLLTGSIKQIDKQVILGTYGSAGLGLDIPRLTCLILAMPRVDIEQAVGRILRRKDNNITPIVVDVIDSSSNIMSKWFSIRKNFYNRRNMKIQEVKYAV